MGNTIIPYEPYHPHLGYTLGITCLVWLTVGWYGRARLARRPAVRALLYALAICVPLYAECTSFTIYLIRPAPDTLVGYYLSHFHAYVVNRIPIDTFLPLAGIWLIIGVFVSLACLSLIRFLVGMRQLRALVAPARPLTSTRYTHLVAMFTSIAAASPIVMMLDLDAPLAFTAGLFGGKIYVTQQLLELLTEDEALAVLCHEWAHIVRRDNLWNSAVRLLRDMLFFLPGSHIAWRWMLASQDEACDRLATMMTSQPLALARALVKVSAAWNACAAPELPTATVNSFALGVSGTQARVEQMIAVLEENERPARSALLGACLLVAVVLILAPLPALLGS